MFSRMNKGLVGEGSGMKGGQCTGRTELNPGPTVQWEDIRMLVQTQKSRERPLSAVANAGRLGHISPSVGTESTHD